MKKLVCLLTVIFICLSVCSCSAIENGIYKNSKSFDDFNDLELDFTSADVNLHVGKEYDNHVDYAIEYSGFVPRKTDIDLIENGDSVTIRQRSFTIIFGIGSVNVDMDVYINKESFDNLDIDMTSGSFELEDKLTLNELDIDMTSGDVDISKIYASEVNVDTTSGAAVIDGSIKNAGVDITSGNVEVISDRMPDNIDAEVTSGNITFAFPDNEDGFRLKYDLTSGDIKSDFLLNGYSGREGTATYGNAKSSIYADLTSGFVYLKKLDKQ